MEIEEYEKIKIDLLVPKKYLEQLKLDKETYKELIWDIIERYGNEDYFSERILNEGKND